MAAEPGDAAAFILDAPFEVLVALFCLLSPKWILRLRAVCWAWREKLNDETLLARLHLLGPPRPLLCLDRVAYPNRYVHLSDYRVESLDLRCGKLGAVFRFTDNDDYDSDEYDLEGLDAPHIEASRVDYERMEENDVDRFRFRQRLLVHASLDGYLLVSFGELRFPRWTLGYVINPATRHWVSLPNLAALGLDVVGFYEHGPTGNYRVLCLSEACSYYVIVVRPGKLRFIGRPISPAAPEDHGLELGVDTAVISPPIQFKRNLHLHWPPQQSQGYHILVFDTFNEMFSWKRPPPVTMRDDQDMSLLEFPTGHIGLSVSRKNGATLELWCLQDYRNEVWVLKHRIHLALQQMPVLQDENPWLPVVVSPEGDVLIESLHGLFHCDRDGNLLRRFWFNQIQSSQRVLPIRHVLRVSLLQHPMFVFRPLKYDVEPPFFRWMCSDSSW